MPVRAIVSVPLGNHDSPQLFLADASTLQGSVLTYKWLGHASDRTNPEICYLSTSRYPSVVLSATENRSVRPRIYFRPGVGAATAASSSGSLSAQRRRSGGGGGGGGGSRKDGLMVDPSIREHTVRRSPVKTPIKASQDERKQTERKKGSSRYQTERKSQIVLNENKRKAKLF